MIETEPRTQSLVDDTAAINTAKAAARPQLHSESSNPNMNGPLYRQKAGSNVILVRRVKRKEEDGAWKSMVRWFVENQIGLSFNLLALLFLSHFFIPKARPYTSRFFRLNYRNSDNGLYGIGSDDCYYVAFWIVLLTGLRAGVMEYILAPFAKMAGAGTKRKDLTRFSEQAWLIVFYCVFWPIGMYIYTNSKWAFNFQELWTDWPQREIDPLMKGYILAQWGFWLQQIIVINIEERRKDHWQMFTHHIITIGLISACYHYHMTRVGNYILVIMDVVDIVLSLAKCLKYCGFTTLCDIMFGVFLVTWFVARHVFHILSLWSIYSDIPAVMDFGCYKGPPGNVTGPFEPTDKIQHLLEPFYDPHGTVCFTTGIQWAFLIPLILLQGLMCLWFSMAVRVAYKVLSGASAEDVRSDDEGDEEDDVAVEEVEEFVYEEAKPLEEDVGVEDLDFAGWERRSGVKRQASSSGVSIPGHSDRKEFLGRIGCEKQVD